MRRYRDVLERRMHGMKKEGEVAVVVTDIEGYSGAADGEGAGVGRGGFGGVGMQRRDRSPILPPRRTPRPPPPAHTHTHNTPPPP